MSQEPESPIPPPHMRHPSLGGTKADAGYGENSYGGEPWIYINPVTGQMWQTPPWSGHALNPDGTARPLSEAEWRLLDKYSLELNPDLTQETPAG